MLALKKVDSPPSGKDGIRILVDRLWPRGLTRREARVDRWVRSVAPSANLRKWFHENPRKWAQFKKKYKEELSTPSKKKVLHEMKGLAQDRKVTLLFASKREKRNNAAALLEILKKI